MPNEDAFACSKIFHSPCLSLRTVSCIGFLALLGLDVTNGVYGGDVTNILLYSSHQHMFSVFLFFSVTLFRLSVRGNAHGVHGALSRTTPELYTHKRVLNNLSQMKNILYATCCCYENVVNR